MNGPRTLLGQRTHAEKYQEHPDEGFEGATRRLSKALSDDEPHRVRLEDIFGNMRFLAGGRVQAAMGGTRTVTPYNCFVSGTIEDSFVHGHGSIMHRAHEAATTMRSGGGDGYNFGTLRPRNAPIRKLQSQSSGPVTFMHIFDAVCRATSSMGNRRGAQMGVMPVWHPDIEEFIDAKKPPAAAQPIVERVTTLRGQVRELKLMLSRLSRQPGDDVARNSLQAQVEAKEKEFWSWFNALQTTLQLTGFNISVGFSDDFMHALRDGKTYWLRWGGKKEREIDPAELWAKIMDSTWEWAEPGALFLDTINNDNNLWYCERIDATNPCGEQPLPPNGACLLGSFNLTRYMFTRSDGSLYLDLDLMKKDIPHVVRAMDNVVDRAMYPLPEQEKEAQSKRRMGLGVTGVANALEGLGLPYGSPQFIEKLEEILQALSHGAYRASVGLAIEKGAFPLLDADKYLDSGHNKRCLDGDLRESIRKHGIRNSHLTSIAPTGTISFAADNISSSIEPVFSYDQSRRVNFMDGPKIVSVQDYGVANFGVRGRKADQLSAREHLDVLIAATRWVDSAVSKTCNVSGNMPRDEFSGLYLRAWENGCKGCTTYNKDGMRAGVIVDADVSEDAGCSFDPATGRKSCE